MVNPVNESSGFNLVELAHSRITKGVRNFTKMSHFCAEAYRINSDWLLEVGFDLGLGLGLGLSIPKG